MNHGERARDLLRRSVVTIYLLQLPLFLGLMLALVVFAVSFFVSIVNSVISLEFLDRREAILLVLDLLDMVFISNLIVMVMVSGYNAYYSTPALRGEDSEWMDHRDEFAPIKSKIAATLVIISGIHILHEVLAEERASVSELLVLGALHIVLLATAAVFVFMSRIER